MSRKTHERTRWRPLPVGSHAWIPDSRPRPAPRHADGASRLCLLLLQQDSLHCFFQQMQRYRGDRLTPIERAARLPREERTTEPGRGG